jgi:hypothetical protein
MATESTEEHEKIKPIIILALTQIEWVDYRCRAEFIRPTAIIAVGDKEVALSCDALRRGRHSLHHQVYCITMVTRGHHPLSTDITTARLLG